MNYRDILEHLVDTVYGIQIYGDSVGIELTFHKFNKVVGATNKGVDYEVNYVIILKKDNRVEYRGNFTRMETGIYGDTVLKAFSDTSEKDIYDRLAKDCLIHLLTVKSVDN